MVQDIIDMRKNGWQARQETAGPKLLAQIREEAKRKEQAEEADRHRQSLSRGGSRQGSSGAARMPTMSEQLGRSSRGSTSSNPEGWSQPRGSRPEKFDHSKFGSVSSAMKRDTDPATVRLGPGTGMATGAKGWVKDKRDDLGATMSRSASSGSASSVTAGSHAASAVRRSVAGVASSTNSFGLLADEEPSGRKSVDDASPPDADVASRAVPVAKITTSADEKPPLHATTPVTAKSSSKLPKEAATRKIDAMIEEFYSNFDPAEAGADFKDLGDGEYHSQAISAILEKVTEKKRNDYIKTADLLVHLAKNEIVTADVIVACLTQYVEAIEDISIDVPEIFKNVAILLSRLLHTGAIRLSQIPQICAGIIDSPARSLPAPKLLAETLYDTKKEYGLDTYSILIRDITSSSNEAGFDLRELFPVNQRTEVVIAEFLEKFEDIK
ncbi:hypothetical protein SeMB42_g07763 [Synchytrium endobioticum]|uniref:MI domain-containing protein n=1 Tax=Synchytrium endobioticum TaxID=286115 RepID=A0A507BMI5_9FUNG|nr:hypothetical protein SeMB42_g07763 [Synchytrium endobioticum]